MTKRIYFLTFFLLFSQLCFSKISIDVYVSDEISGVYAPAFKSKVNIKLLESVKDKDNASVILMTGQQINAMRHPLKLKQLYENGWVYLITNASAKQINSLHKTLSNGQKFATTNNENNNIEAFGFSNRQGNGSESGYAQTSIHLLNEYEGSNQASLMTKRAGQLYQWAKQRLSPSHEIKKTHTLQLDSSGSQVLTNLVSAWPDSHSFYYQDSGNQSLFQCSVSVWQAYQVNTEYDYYYIQQFCNLSPQNTYSVKGKKLETSWGFYEDWDDVNWSTTTNYCVPSSDSGNIYTACNLHDYVTNYSINLTPYFADSSMGADSDPNEIILEVEAPATTQNDTTVTQGVSYSIGGSVVAGYNAASVSVSAGVTISDSTTTTIPDVSIENQSNTANNNAAWNYVMPKVAYIDDVCTNTMNNPTSSQITTFAPLQEMIWQVNKSYREQEGFDGYFNVNMEFNVAIDTSTMYVDEKGTIGVSNKSDCNLASCSCAIVHGTNTYKSGTYVMSIPVPGTGYQDPE